MSSEKRKRSFEKKLSQLSLISRQKDEFFKKRNSEIARSREIHLEQKIIEEEMKLRRAKMRKSQVEEWKRRRREEEDLKSRLKAEEVLRTKTLLDEMKKILHKKNVEDYEQKKMKGSQLKQIFEEIHKEKMKTEVCKYSGNFNSNHSDWRVEGRESEKKEGEEFQQKEEENQRKVGKKNGQEFGETEEPG